MADKCLIEVKRVIKDLLTDDEVNTVLTRVKSNLAAEQALKKANIEESKLAQKVIDEIEIEQAINKRNLANDTIKVLERSNHIIDSWSKDPIKGIRAILVGIQDFGKGSRRSIGNDQAALEEEFMTNLFTDLKKAGGNALDAFQNGKLDIEVYRELAGENTGVKDAKVIAEIVKKHNEHVRTILNNLGANIGKLDDWITRQYHDPDKLIGAAGRSITDWKQHQSAWREIIKPLLDLERTFGGAKNIDEILDDMWLKLRSGVFFKNDGLDAVYGSQSIVKKLSEGRVLHFKNADARFKYDQKFGNPRLRESVVHGLQLSARNIGIMNSFGTKPEANFKRMLKILEVHFAKINPKLDGKFKFEKFKNEFMEVDGSVYQVDNAMGAKIGMALRFFQGTGKLGFATISSFADLATYMTESRFQGRGLFTGLAEALGQLTGLGRNKVALDVLGVMSNTTIGVMNQKFSGRGDMTGKFASLSNKFYQLNALNWWVSNLKSAMTVGVARLYGMKRSLTFDKLSAREQNILTMYGIDNGKWNMLRSISALEADGKTYITAEKIDEISIESIDSYLGRKVSKREADNFRQDLHISYRNLLLDRAMHGTPEPDAAVRADLNRGWKRGTVEGELMRFFTQFKSFPVAIYQKVIGRELRGYNPANESVGRNRATGLASMVIFGTMMGYLSMTVKDLLKGKSPRDMNKLENWGAAFVQGGGMGIYGDFLYSELKNGYGGSLQETAMGPAFADLSKFIASFTHLINGDMKKFGKSNYSILEGNTPFLNLFYTKAAYDYLIGYHIKEFLDPGYFRRMRRKAYKNQGSKYFLTP